MFAFAARFLFSYFIVVKKFISRNLRDQHIMWKYTEVNRTWIKSVDVTTDGSQRSDGDGEHITNFNRSSELIYCIFYAK